MRTNTFFLIFFCLTHLSFIGCNSRKIVSTLFVNQENIGQPNAFIQADRLFLSSAEDKVTSDSMPLPSILIDGNKFFLLEGDILLDELEYREYMFKKSFDQQIEFITKNNRRLISHEFAITENLENIVSTTTILELRNGEIVKWPKDKVISYCIDRSSFMQETQYIMVKESLSQATNDWEDVCDISFKYKPELDYKPGIKPSDSLAFVVKLVNADFIASAFFPYYDINKRYLYVTQKYFQEKISKPGILRHEIGHILGFRHEHIRKQLNSCPSEANTHNILLLGSYDPNSVMHYFCAGMKNHNLVITKQDIWGAQLVYGMPKSKRKKR